MNNLLTMLDVTQKILSELSNTRDKDDLVEKNIKYVIKTKTDIIQELNKSKKINEIATTAALPVYQTTGGVSNVNRYQIYPKDEIYDDNTYRNSSIKCLYAIFESDEHIYDAKDDYMIYPLKEKIKEYIFSNKDRIEEIFSEVYYWILEDDDIELEDLLTLCGTAVIAFLDKLGISIPYTLGNSIIELFFIIYNHVIKTNHLVNFIITHTFLQVASDDELSNKLVVLTPITLRYDNSIESEFANLNFVKNAIVSLPNNVLFEYVKMNLDKLYDYIITVIDRMDDSDMLFNMKGYELKLLKKIFLKDEQTYISFLKYIFNNKLELLTRLEVSRIYESILKEYEEYNK